MFQEIDDTVVYKRVRNHGSNGFVLSPENGMNGDRFYQDKDIELVTEIPLGDFTEKDSKLTNGDWDPQDGASILKEPAKCPSGPDDYDMPHGGCTSNLCRSAKLIFVGSKLNILMLATPFAFLAEALNWNDAITFLLSLLAIAPFAERLGYVTEQLAMHTNDTLGGLINASFGNVTELIVSVFALLKGRPGATDHPDAYRRLVQVSLLGSVLSNLLLVLGSSFLIGGIKHPVQNYTRIGATTSMSLLFLGAVTLALPAVLESTGDVENTEVSILSLSRVFSIILLGVYFVFLYFQLVTHRSLYENEAEEDEDEEDDEMFLGLWGALGWLGVLTVFIALLSEIMVDAIEGTVRHWNVSELFIGSIVIPIVGNAAEHASAIIFAYRNKMDITLGVAIGSAVQISIMAVPLCVILGGIIGCPLDLAFSLFETVSLTLSICIVSVCLRDGKSHFMSGVVLVATYLVIAGGFWVQKSNL